MVEIVLQHVTSTHSLAVKFLLMDSAFPPSRTTATTANSSNFLQFGSWECSALIVPGAVRILVYSGI